MNRLFRNILIVMMVLCTQAISFLALETIDPNKPSSLVVVFDADGTLIPNAKFKVWRIAEIENNNRFPYVSPFQSLGDAIVQMEEDDWVVLVDKVKNFIDTNNPGPTRSGTTYSNGEWNTGITQTGIYFVMGEEIEVDGVTYKPSPFIVSLPSKTAEDTLEYQVNAKVKYEKEDPSDPTPTTTPSSSPDPSSSPTPGGGSTTPSNLPGSGGGSWWSELIPNTGDEDMLWKWAVIFSAACMGIIYLLFWKKKTTI